MQNRSCHIESPSRYLQPAVSNPRMPGPAQAERGEFADLEFKQLPAAVTSSGDMHGGVSGFVNVCRLCMRLQQLLAPAPVRFWCTTSRPNLTHQAAAATAVAETLAQSKTIAIEAH